MKKLLFLFLAFLLACPLLNAQTLSVSGSPCVTGLLSITQTDAKAHMNVLAADSLRGRKGGTDDTRKAAQYIVKQLQNIGIEPFAPDYRQCFTKKIRHYKMVDNKLVTDSLTLDLCNVLGVIRGYDTSRYVIVGAHYDHVGVSKNIEPDSIFNGADDNASGVTGVLQIAKAFIASGKTPLVNIIFAFWDAEEMGLVGSQYFVENFFLLRKINGYINLDMIGRNNFPENPYYVSYNYPNSYPVLGHWLKNDIALYHLKLKPQYNALQKVRYGSDHFHFAFKGVPIIYYHTGIHADYHKPSDEIDKIDWNVMENVTKAAYLSAWNWAYGYDLPAITRPFYQPDFSY